MIYKAFLISLLLFCLSNRSYSQFQHPIGKWKLVEHWVFEKNNPTFENLEKELNVFKNEFEAFIVFDSSGKYYYQKDDSILHGSWKLKRNNRKLIIKMNDGSKHVQSAKTPLNFHYPIILYETHTELYKSQNNNFLGGESIYVRVIPESNSLDSNLLLGKWNVSFIQSGRKMKEYNGHWHYEFKKEAYDQKIFGKWILSDPELISDEVINTEEWNPLSVNYFVEQTKSNKFILIGVRNKKIEFLYLDKIE